MYHPKGERHQMLFLLLLLLRWISLCSMSLWLRVRMREWRRWRGMAKTEKKEIQMERNFSLF